MDTAYLAITVLLVGFVSGCTSVGGVLLVPAIIAWSSLEPRVVIGTTLLAFFFAGLAATFVHHRAGRIDFRSALPLCLGAVLFGYAGAVAKQYVPVPVLSGLLGAAIVAAGIPALRPIRKGTGIIDRLSPTGQRNGLFLVGACVAFLSGMTGAGGPVLSVPAMLLLGYPAIAAIATARPLQLVVTLSASIGNIMVGSVDYSMALFVGALMVVAMSTGAYCMRFFNPQLLRIGVSVLCILTGLYMFARSFLL